MKYTPEDARRLFADDDVGDILERDLLEALRDGKLPDFFCQKLVFFRLYSDDLPGSQLVAEWHPDFPQMKCRNIVIGAIVHYIQCCVEYNIVTDADLTASMREFTNIQWNSDKGSQREHWTTQEEIDLINTTLDHVISSIETTYGILTDWEKARQRLDEERKTRRKSWGA